MECPSGQFSPDLGHMVSNTGYCKLQMDGVTHDLILFLKFREEGCLCEVTLGS